MFSSCKRLSSPTHSDHCGGNCARNCWGAPSTLGGTNTIGGHSLVNCPPAYRTNTDTPVSKLARGHLINCQSRRAKAHVGCRLAHTGDQKQALLSTQSQKLAILVTVDQIFLTVQEQFVRRNPAAGAGPLKEADQGISSEDIFKSLDPDFHFQVT